MGLFNLGRLSRKTADRRGVGLRGEEELGERKGNGRRPAEECGARRREGRSDAESRERRVDGADEEA